MIERADDLRPLRFAPGKDFVQKKPPRRRRPGPLAPASTPSHELRSGGRESAPSFQENQSRLTSAATFYSPKNGENPGFCPHKRKMAAQIRKSPHGTGDRPHGLENRRTDRKTAARNEFSAHGMEVCPHETEARLWEAIFARTERFHTGCCCVRQCREPATNPAPFRAKGICFNVRPHPGPLLQERENRTLVF